MLLIGLSNKRRNVERDEFVVMNLMVLDLTKFRTNLIAANRLIT